MTMLHVFDKTEGKAYSLVTVLEQHVDGVIVGVDASCRDLMTSKHLPVASLLTIELPLLGLSFSSVVARHWRAQKILTHSNGREQDGFHRSGFELPHTQDTGRHVADGRVCGRCSKKTNNGKVQRFSIL